MSVLGRIADRRVGVASNSRDLLVGRDFAGESIIRGCRSGEGNSAGGEPERHQDDHVCA
jgi:hypothetical protein